MEPLLSSALAGAFDPAKLLLALAVVLLSKSNKWVFAAALTAVLVAYVTAAATILQLTNSQVLIHLASSAILLVTLALLTFKLGSAATATATVCLTVLSFIAIFGTVSHRGPVSGEITMREGLETDVEHNGVAWKMSNAVAAPASTLVRSFEYGENIAVRFAREIDRKLTSGPANAEWRAGSYHDWMRNRQASIPGNREWLFVGTRNQAEAEHLLADILTELRAARLNDARSDEWIAIIGLLFAMSIMLSLVLARPRLWPSATQPGKDAQTR